MIKRTLRKARLPYTEDVVELAGFFMAHPWALTGAIEHKIGQSVKAYERGDDQREQWYAEDVETLMSLIGVRLTWPGLYPTYVYQGEKPATMPPGLWRTEEYDLAGLWALLKDVRKYESEVE